MAEHGEWVKIGGEWIQISGPHQHDTDGFEFFREA